MLVAQGEGESNQYSNDESNHDFELYIIVPYLLIRISRELDLSRHSAVRSDDLLGTQATVSKGKEPQAPRKSTLSLYHYFFFF